MRCFVAGANGFIGRHVVETLRAAGWSVVGGARDLGAAQRLMPDVTWTAVNFNRDTDASLWQQRLAGFDAVVNCVGVLQSGLGDDSRRVHVGATVAMFKGAAAAGVRRGVHVSALGADANGKTAFARDKAAADALLLTSGMDIVVLRPSLVYAREAYGGTRVVRMLAGLPAIVPVFSGEMAFDPIHADDLGRIVVRCLDADVPARRIYEVGGPDRLSTREIIAATRNWLRFPPPRFVEVPAVLARPVFLLGDLFGWLGARQALRSTMLIQAQATPPAQSGAIIAATGIRPRAIGEALAAMPATAADRQAARLAFPLAALRIALAIFWIASGLVALLPGPFAAARSIAEAAGISSSFSGLAVAFAALVDITLGLPLLVGRWVRTASLLQAMVMVIYAAALGAMLPALWGDPLGSLVKTLPIVFAALVIAASAEER